MLSQEQIDTTIDEFDSIRLRLVNKYGAAFSGMSPAEQSRVIRDIYDIATGKA